MLRGNVLADDALLGQRSGEIILILCLFGLVLVYVLVYVLFFCFVFLVIVFVLFCVLLLT